MGVTDNANVDKQELSELGSAYMSSITSYLPSLGRVSLPVRDDRSNGDPSPEHERYSALKVQADVAGQVVKDLHVASNAENAVNRKCAFQPLLIPAPLDSSLFDQMRSCHTAATEFLRQYWAALLPLPAGALGGGPNTVPKNKDARDPVKATKMANYLRSTEKKIEAVVHTAALTGQDAERVKAVSSDVYRGLYGLF